MQETLADLVKANRALDAAALRSTDEILAGFRRAEAKAFSRLRELLVGAPNFSRENLGNRLKWYFANIPSLEIAQAQASFAASVKSYLDAYPSLGGMASGILGAGGVPKGFTSIPRELIEALASRDRAFFNELNAEALSRLDRQLLDSVVVGRTPAGALADIRGVITGSYPWGKTRGLYEWHAGTYARTAQMQFSRQVLKAKADELQLKTFAYVGPVDSKKRPFCLERVGGAFTREEIDDMDNNQTGDVFTTGGGFNCRDTWSPIDKQLFDALREESGQDALKQELEKQAKTSIPPTLKPTPGSKMENDAWIRSLTKDEYAALEEWKNIGYAEMRASQFKTPAELQELYRGLEADLLKIQQRVKIMEQALDRARPFSGEVFRGMGGLTEEAFKSFVEAKTITWNALSSSSTIAEKGAQFAQRGGRRILFRIKGNKTGIDIKNINGFDKEGEVVLRKGARYRVDKVERATSAWTDARGAIIRRGEVENAIIHMTEI
jgi:hypothetical protein